jgi:hypothetical protein
MTTFLTILIFTLATAAAAEISIWGPDRRARQEITNRLRGLRVSAGPRTGSLLRQQQFTVHRLEITKNLQAIIDQGRLPYRAGKVLTFSALLLVGSYVAADLLQLFPFLVLRLFFATAAPFYRSFTSE